MADSRKIEGGFSLIFQKFTENSLEFQVFLLYYCCFCKRLVMLFFRLPATGSQQCRADPALCSVGKQQLYLHHLRRQHCVARPNLPIFSLLLITGLKPENPHFARGIPNVRRRKKKTMAGEDEAEVATVAGGGGGIPPVCLADQ